MGGQKLISFFQYFSITTGIGVSFFAVRLPKTDWFLHISLYKRNNAVSCCNTCSDSVLFKILCYLLTDSVNTRFEKSTKTYCFTWFLSCGSLSLGLYVQSHFHLNWASFHSKNDQNLSRRHPQSTKNPTPNAISPPRQPLRSEKLPEGQYTSSLSQSTSSLSQSTSDLSPYTSRGGRQGICGGPWGRVGEGKRH